MKKLYTDEKNVQILIALLKAHGIRKVIASPGSANSPLTGSMQRDPYFEMYSSVDERSAAYMACGLAAESGQPVVLSCTGATASRNYLPGLTEAFYRKLPVLAITSTQQISRIGHHVAQVIDRSNIPKDVAKLSVPLPVVKDSEDFWHCEININKAILELYRHGGGPAHINLSTNALKSYTTKTLPKVRAIKRITNTNAQPKLQGKTAVFIGSHKRWSAEETKALDNFCAANDAVVFCDHTSGYKGEYRLLYALPASQQMLQLSSERPDILIHIGEVSGDYSVRKIAGKEVWRVSEDGEIRDTFRKVQYVFEMPEKAFFESYTQDVSQRKTRYLNACQNRLKGIREQLPDVPFSNIWVASKLAHLIPESASIHFGILNSLRSWNLFELPETVSSDSNVGGFGIDGCVSSLVGAALANKNKIFFGVIGDLAFFYDMNAIGNRHLTNNIRILLVNNGKGTEFRQYNHHTSHFGEDADEFIAAAGHFGNQSQTIVKNYSEGLGFEYMSASNKNEFHDIYHRFITPEITDRPMVFEIFTDSDQESKALELIMNIEGNMKGKAKKIVKEAIGKDRLQKLKKIIK